jgi:hypothetical protein
MFGIVAALVGALALWGTYRPVSLARLTWPVLTFLIGFCLFVPVEAQSRTYQVTGWWDTFVSVVPQHPLTWVRDWLHYLTQRHVIQHKVGALCIMAVGVIEHLRARGRLAGLGWQLALPALMFGTAIAFGVHGGTAAHLSHRTEQIHHHVLGVALVVAAVSLALARTGMLRARAWEGVWAVLVLVVGLDIALFYRLTSTERTEVHHHESSDPGMR